MMKLLLSGNAKCHSKLIILIIAHSPFNACVIRNVGDEVFSLEENEAYSSVANARARAT